MRRDPSRHGAQVNFGLVVRLAGMSGLLVGATSTQGAEATASCDPPRQLEARVAVDAQLLALSERYSWVKRSADFCGTLAVGNRSDQAALVAGCLVKACTGSNCAADVPTLAQALERSAAARQDQQRQRAICRSRSPAVDRGDALETYFQYQLAALDGDRRTARALTSGSDAEFADDAETSVEFNAAADGFFGASEKVFGATATELARLVFALRPKDVSFAEYNATVAGDTARIASPKVPEVSALVREGGKWKIDLGRLNEKDTTRGQGGLQKRLMAHAFQVGARMIDQRRVAHPVVALAGVNQCFILGSMIVLQSLSAASNQCDALLERRFSATKTSEAAQRPSLSSGSSGDFQAVIDNKFIDWSGSWTVDEYTPDSVRIAKRQCSGDGCVVTGEFSFTRLQTPLTIPFEAVFEGGALVRLCYTDTSRGRARGCTR